MKLSQKIAHHTNNPNDLNPLVDGFINEAKKLEQDLEETKKLFERSKNKRLDLEKESEQLKNELETIKFYNQQTREENSSLKKINNGVVDANHALIDTNERRSAELETCKSDSEKWRAEYCRVSEENEQLRRNLEIANNHRDDRNE